MLIFPIFHAEHELLANLLQTIYNSFSCFQTLHTPSSITF